MLATIVIIAIALCLLAYVGVAATSGAYKSIHLRSEQCCFFSWLCLADFLKLLYTTLHLLYIILVNDMQRNCVLVNINKVISGLLSIVTTHYFYEHYSCYILNIHTKSNIFLQSFIFHVYSQWFLVSLVFCCY